MNGRRSDAGRNTTLLKHGAQTPVEQRIRSAAENAGEPQGCVTQPEQRVAVLYRQITRLLNNAEA
ncbi:hypothetical protein BN439_1796 [Erwinia amylovora Ea644]|uniref:hypothetical protein n=1 Tax=Erwinia amylovora TaxID=552 RepID=UPI0002CAAA87|nr:hypothetical protein [Erwinia amylovora]CCP02857.1 hypothetical protein BN439_1796 [Erwinia amylovora Ea644]CCP06888.1 hypothetical protein BN440_1862 [Erwinia amylovora MR1]